MDFETLVHEAWPAYEQRRHDGGTTAGFSATRGLARSVLRALAR